MRWQIRAGVAAPCSPTHMMDSQSFLARAVRFLEREDAVLGECLDDLRPGR